MALSDALNIIKTHITDAQAARAAAAAADATENAADAAVAADLQTVLDAIASGKVLIVPDAATLPIPTGTPANPLAPVVGSMLDGLQSLVDGVQAAPGDTTDVSEGIAFVKAAGTDFIRTVRFLLASTQNSAGA